MFYAYTELYVTEEFRDWWHPRHVALSRRIYRTSLQSVYTALGSARVVTGSAGYREFEPLTTHLQDVPEKVRDYVLASEDDELHSQVD
ncbi:LOW QUALITY PROTEIN: hypothetical protein PHMEG_0007863 [Phytophthora megakarya]|uniref:Uncharacterized protein n=1 Tax=Phytophthora megakarya TaxID=4795 RepID=A0A225WLH1_9STRA|nr:LOW QUALITY PROTEIN: hypothetical protein PHMEG_0007863 [Phytophthora megakarya]